MNIIIPMAGMGTRLRPHTLTIPKPLIPVAGIPIVHRLVTDIAQVCNERIKEIAFIVHPNFGKDIENTLINLAQKLGAKGTIYYQKEALGTAHAVHCASQSLKGNTIVAFADTLFIANFTLDTSKDAVIWVQKVKDPSAFGVVKTDADERITDFIEKPKEFVSDLAIIGIYYFKQGEILQEELQYLLDNDIHVNGEYQLTTALENMKKKGTAFYTGKIDEWLDCGNKDAVVHTNSRLLAKYGSSLDPDVTIINSHIIEPCCVQKGVTISNSIIGPEVTIGANSSIENSVISHSLIQNNATLSHVNCIKSMIGNNAHIQHTPIDYNIGDFTCIKK
ncbi:MAG TPA: sugar phosphate nucleotidyltransferase [Bacteroidales bacterium]|nr:sugar phosphate nucleotidyltransferase [Bacteroidales bacterium]